MKLTSNMFVVTFWLAYRFMVKSTVYQLGY